MLGSTRGEPGFDIQYDTNMTPIRRPDRTSSMLGRSINPLFMSLLLWGCAREAPPPSILLITIDTCRADHLSCYGYAKPTTPNLDQLAKEGALFRNANTSAPMTFPAHASLMTGAIPPHHGVHDNLNFRLTDDNITLAERLAERGYQTGAIVSAFVLDSRFHLDQGFASYDDELGDEARPDLGSDANPFHAGEENERHAGETTRLAGEWLDRHVQQSKSADPNVPFFLFVHYFDPHAAYEPPEPFASRFPDDPYAGEIAYTDAEIGKLIDHLRSLGLYEKTAIVVMGDHGESLGEHGEDLHDYFVYQSTIHVPLLIRMPGGPRGQEIDDPVSIIDVAPTLLSMSGVPVDDTMAGIDLSVRLSETARTESAGNEDERRRYLYCESVSPARYGCNPVLAVISDRWKFIQSSRPELYDLDVDPKELDNVIDENANRAAFLEVQLNQILEEQTRIRSGSGAEPDAETRERLQSLGYLSGRASGEGLQFDRSRPDAKDYIAAHATFLEASQATSAGNYEGVKSLGLALLDAYPQIIDVHLLLGGAANAALQLEEAEREYRRFLVRLDELAHGPDGAVVRERFRPSAVKAHFNLANVLIEKGERAEAVEEYRSALALDPSNSDAHFNLGITLAEDGNVTEALNEFLTTTQLDPDFPEAHYNAGLALLFQGRTDQGRSHLETAIRLNPGYVDPRLQLADLMISAKDLNGALAQVRAAREARPDLPEPHLRMARILFATGDARGAIEIYREAARALPDRPEIANELAWILATHPDARLRNGAEAQQLAERLTSEHPDQPALLATLAAAYAEVGRFDDAIRAQESVLAAVRRSGDSSAIQSNQAILERLRRHEPIRGR